jgi:fermentation-respiration switch protein FrsA (DUF1100 family)
LNHNIEKPASNRPQKKQGRLRNLCKRLVVYAGILYVAVLLMLVANETSLVYPGSDYPRGDWNPTHFDFEEVTFTSADGTELVGWYLEKPDSTPAGDPVRTVLLCHGNGENVSQSTATSGDTFRRVLNADVFVFDYRGFGKCSGSPSEAGVLADADAALDWICKRSEKSPSQIILVGHSLGGGPAVHLAANRGCKALILQRTFNSLADAAQSHYPWLPVKYIMRNQYPSEEKIKSCSMPLYQSHGSVDKMIPVSLARKLYENSPAKSKVFNEIEGLGHLDPLPRRYWAELKQFIDSIDQVASTPKR